jgi:hypothetical protein
MVRECLADEGAHGGFGGAIGGRPVEAVLASFVVHAEHEERQNGLPEP